MKSLDIKTFIKGNQLGLEKNTITPNENPLPTPKIDISKPELHIPSMIQNMIKNDLAKINDITHKKINETARRDILDPIRSAPFKKKTVPTLIKIKKIEHK